MPPADEDRYRPELHDFELTFDRSPIGMALVEPDGTWARVNAALCDMFGYAADELLSGRFADITHPDDLLPDLALVQECLRGERDGYRLGKRYRHRDGSWVWGELSVVLVRGDDGHPHHFISQVVDVTRHHHDRDELEVAMAELSRSNAGLAEFAAVASHELKTPLSGLRAALELMDDVIDGGDSATVRGIARRAQVSADRLNALLDALLAYSRVIPGTDGTQSIARPTRLREITDSAEAEARDVLRRGGARVTSSPGIDASPPVWASAELIRTVIVTVFSNAVKYRDRSRPLHIQLDAAPTTHDREVMVSVTNDGPPIPPEDRERVLQMYTRSRPTPGTTGFGIGLAACSRIVAWHGGRVWIEEPPEGGVSVRFTLPTTRHPASHITT